MTIFKEKKLSDVLNWIPNIKRIKPIDIKRYRTRRKVSFLWATVD